MGTAQLHITNGNCKKPCSGILGFVRLGHGFAIPTPLYTTFFCARKTLRVFLIGHKKRQLPRTLCEIQSYVDRRILKYDLTKFDKKGLIIGRVIINEG